MAGMTLSCNGSVVVVRCSRPLPAARNATIAVSSTHSRGLTRKRRTLAPSNAGRSSPGAAEPLEEAVDLPVAGLTIPPPYPSDECLCSSTDPTTSSSSSSSSDSGSPLQALLSSLRHGSPHDSAIFALALPAVLALAADPLLQVVDTVFVGQTGGPDALGALGVNSALFTLSFLVFNFLATATTPLIASSLATGDRKTAGKVTAQALLLAGGLGTALAAVLALGADAALGLMGAPPGEPVHVLAKDFLLIRSLAAPAVLVVTVGQGVFRGMQDMRTPLAVTLTANVINLGLDILLIVGLGWGVSGAATATTVAEWTAAAAYLGLLWRRREELGGAPALQSALQGGSVKQVAAEFAPFLSAGGAVLLRTAALLGTKTLASATAARLGPVPIASHQVVMQLWLLSSMVLDSLAVAGQTLVAVQLGKGDVPQARAVSNRLLQLGVGGGVALAATFTAAGPLIPAIFTNDASVQLAVMSVLPLAVGMLPINAAVYVLDGILVGCRDFKWMSGAMGAAALTAVALLVGVEPWELGLQGVWGALAVLMVSRLVTLVWRYQSAGGPLPPPLPLPAAAAVVPVEEAGGGQ